MYLDRPTLNAIRRLSFGGPHGGRRFFFLSQAIFRGVRALVATGRRLDDLLYPAHVTENVDRPVFIFAPPRSGTTYLHRLLSQDEDRFTHVRLYQTLLQSVTFTRAVERLAMLDRPLYGLPSRVLEAADRRFFGGWRDIHPMGLNQAEEDEGFLVFSLLSPGAFVFYPWVVDLPRAVSLDSVEEPVRRTVMAEYRSSVQRHLFANGRGRTWLNKTVLLAGRLQSVTETFPDARFIYLVRHPYETVPSFVSMFTTFWPAFYSGWTADPEAVRQLAQLAIDYTKRSLELLDKLTPDRYLVVRYTELVAEPRKVVEDIYRHFGWKISEPLNRRLEAQIAAARGYRPRHEYSLERYGIERRMIHDQLRPFFDQFGFDRQLDPDPDPDPDPDSDPDPDPDPDDEWIEDDALDAP